MTTPKAVLDHPWYLYTYTPDHTRYVFRDAVKHSLTDAVVYANDTREQATAETPPPVYGPDVTDDVLADHRQLLADQRARWSAEHHPEGGST